MSTCNKDSASPRNSTYFGGPSSARGSLHAVAQTTLAFRWQGTLHRARQGKHPKELDFCWKSARANHMTITVSYTHTTCNHGSTCRGCWDVKTCLMLPILSCSSFAQVPTISGNWYKANWTRREELLRHCCLVALRCHSLPLPATPVNTSRVARTAASSSHFQFSSYPRPCAWNLNERFQHLRRWLTMVAAQDSSAKPGMAGGGRGGV